MSGFLHDNASNHVIPCSPDLTLYNFWLFLKLQTISKKDAVLVVYCHYGKIMKKFKGISEKIFLKVAETLEEVYAHAKRESLEENV